MERAYKTKINELKNQLVGAIRRINYLIEEKNRIFQDQAKRAQYVSKLELEVVRSKNEIKALTRKFYNLAQSTKKQDENKEEGYSGRNKEYVSPSIKTERRYEKCKSGGKTDKEYARILKEMSIQSLKDVDKEIKEAQEEVLIKLIK